VQFTEKFTVDEKRSGSVLRATAYLHAVKDLVAKTVFRGL